ncbi:MAG: toxin-antitoxin system HicB family antitoxin [Oscillospiraceae bacterium]|nr:toxin-antitoxin system HicB family antitoxin [Oscillospiraceae bacterium]
MNNNILEYKGYRGSAEYSAADKIFWGQLMGISDSVTYEGNNQSELQADFEAAVNDYLETCAEIGKPPEREIRTTETTNNDIQLRRSYATI